MGYVRGGRRGGGPECEVAADGKVQPMCLGQPTRESGYSNRICNAEFEVHLWRVRVTGSPSEG